MALLALLGTFLLVVGVRGSLPMVVGGSVLLVAVVFVARRVRVRREAPPTPRLSMTSRASTAADVLIVIGVLPALAMFWMVVPALLALAVIGGVVSTGRGTREPAAA